MAEDKTCLKCGSTFRVAGSRVLTAKYCSRACSDTSKKKKPETRCAQCGAMFHRKKSRVDKTKFGSFCNTKCHSAYKSENNTGPRNPNYKGSGVDYDGYVLYVPHSTGGVKERKLHRATVAEIFGIDRLPDGVHVHHRDCNVLNNDPGNLAMMTPADNKWIHKQYGSSTLWAIQNDRVSIAEASSWSSNPRRANRLLSLDCMSQFCAYKFAKSKGLDAVSGALMAEFEVVTDLELVEVFE